MAKKKASKKRNPRSEAAMREAYVKRSKLTFGFKFPIFYCYEWNPKLGRWLILAIFDLRDCYRKRAPLKGVTKELKKVMTKRRR